MKMWLPIIMSSVLVLSACGGGSDTDTASKSDDTDKDTISNTVDNCPSVFNTTQRDQDNDGIGDACDSSDDRDSDNDGVVNELDNCKFRSNADQSDVDGDKIGDVCDTQDDRNSNNDNDNDGITNTLDNCPLKSNPDQSDADGDGIGDVCDTEENKDDKDKDGIADDIDNCPSDPNTDQNDKDGDTIGDVCDTEDDRDNDKDGIINIEDNCPLHSNADQSDVDNDGIGDVCDGSDTDGDGVLDKHDDFPGDATKAASVTSAHRLLNQATFGPTELEIDKIVGIGVEAWVDEQLAKPSAYDNTSDNHKTHLERTASIAKVVQPDIPWEQSTFQFNAGPGIPIWQARYYQMSAWWENALGHPTNTKHGSDQLRQRIAYALSQLLVVSGKDPRLYLRGDSLAYYYDILAKNAFGNYRTLLGEVSRSAPMGVYLTYQGNQKANPEKSTRPDENFARELIQLFTVGLYELNIDGSPNRDANPDTYPDAGTHQVPTYTQKDIVEMAKVMTGWDVKGNTAFGRTHMRKSQYAGQMEFFPEHHEDEIAEGGDGQVTVLGSTFALNSGTDGSGLDAALDVIFNHPNIAPFVSRNLIMNLVTSNPSSDYIARVATVFNDNGQGVKGDLKAVIKAILTDEEVKNSSQNIAFGKVKEPFLVFTQLLRTFSVEPIDGLKGPKDTDRGDGSIATVNGVYSYINADGTFGQAPLRSKSVFNFYMPDYTPSHSDFAESKYVSPESQIMTDGNIMAVHNRIAYYLRRYEKNRITKIDNKTLAEFVSTKSFFSSHLMLINYDRELALFEQALDGDTNGDFDKMGSIISRERAVNELLVHLDKLMLGNTMSDEFRSTLGDYLKNSSSFNSTTNKYEGAHHLISDAVRFIATSSAYMTQK